MIKIVKLTSNFQNYTISGFGNLLEEVAHILERVDTQME